MVRIKWVDEQLQTWALWVGRDTGYSGGSTMFEYRVSQTKDVRAGLRNFDPRFNEEAWQMDRAILSLASDLNQTVIAAYTWGGGAETIAAQLGITRATLHRRLCAADARIVEWLDAKKARAAQIRNSLNYASYT
jgi:hypothetical protein